MVGSNVSLDKIIPSLLVLTGWRNKSIQEELCSMEYIEGNQEIGEKHEFIENK